MADTLTKEERSRRMALIKGGDTKPEIAVRRMAHGLGYRFRLHRANLPGRPDLVFPRLKRVVFVHGCFWHRHAGCALARMPKSRLEFWAPKLEANRLRDERKLRELKKAGWTAMVVWECELQSALRVRARLRRFLRRGDAKSR